jgi:hypothetical protein
MRPTVLVAALLLAFWAMAVTVSPRVGATADEPLHLAGGYSYWRFNDYDLQPENGNLPMRVQTAPLLAMELKFPRRIVDRAELQWTESIAVAHEFVFGLGNPFDAMLWRARAATALFGVVTLWLAWRWARHLFGKIAGLLALAIGAFCPTLLAHSGLATSDAAIASGLLAAVTACWLVLHRVSWLRLLAAPLAVAAALLAKFSAVMLAPIAIALLVIRCVHPAPLVVVLGQRALWLRRRSATIATTLGLAFMTAAVAIVIVWAAYGFRYSAFRAQRVANGDTPALNWAEQDEALTSTGAAPLIAWARQHRILPEAYLYGFTFSYVASRARPAFLMGKTSWTGWPEFFPVAFLLKTPPTALLLLLAGVGALAASTACRRRYHARWPRRGWFYRSTPLLVLFVLYWAIAINTPLNIGHRHLLPIYPIIYVAIGAATGWLIIAGRRRALATLALAGITAVHALDSWSSRPFYLSYFTPWIGGADQGWRYLVDSSLDWGQGLPDLSAWIRAKEARGDRSPVYLTYFGTDSPEARRLPVTRFGDLVDDLSPRTFPARVGGGWFAIGATHFQGGYLRVYGPWTNDREALYQGLMQELASAPPNIAQLAERERRKWAQAAQNYERLQFGRLVHFLRAREPDGFIGGSLLLFRLTDPEVQAALYGPFKR